MHRFGELNKLLPVFLAPCQRYRVYIYIYIYVCFLF